MEDSAVPRPPPSACMLPARLRKTRDLKECPSKVSDGGSHSSLGGPDRRPPRRSHRGVQARSTRGTSPAPSIGPRCRRAMRIQAGSPGKDMLRPTATPAGRRISPAYVGALVAGDDDGVEPSLFTLSPRPAPSARRLGARHEAAPGPWRAHTPRGGTARAVTPHTACSGVHDFRFLVLEAEDVSPSRVAPTCRSGKHVGSEVSPQPRRKVGLRRSRSRIRRHDRS